MINVQIAGLSRDNTTPRVKNQSKKASLGRSSATSESKTQIQTTNKAADEKQNSTLTFRIDGYEHKSFDTYTQMSSVSVEGFSPEQIKGLCGDLEFAEFHYVDWDSIEESFSKNSMVDLDNASTIATKANGIASLYVATQKRIEKEYGDDEEQLAENMERLNALYEKTKQSLVDSYGRTVGNYYENMGNKGVKERMCESLSKEIDQRLEDCKAYAEKIGYKDRDIIGGRDGQESDAILLNIALQIRDFEGLTPNTAKEGEYSLTDLKAAGSMIQLFNQMKQTGFSAKDDYHLGLEMAVRYMKMSSVLEHLGVSDDMSSMLMGSFKNCLDRDSGNSLTKNNDTSKIFEYMVKQYQKTGDILLAIDKGAKKFIGDEFFLLYSGKDSAMMAESTYYKLNVDNFTRNLQEQTVGETWCFFSDYNINAFCKKA